VLLEQKYRLSFFESLYTALVIKEGYTMISADSQSRKINELLFINRRKFEYLS
jgi:hypothetical protein